MKNHFLPLIGQQLVHMNFQLDRANSLQHSNVNKTAKLEWYYYKGLF